MQTIYSLETMNNEIPPEGAVRILKKNMEQSKQLFTYLVYFITEIALYADVDALQKSSKHLPNYSDLNINTKIATNAIITSVLQNKSFKKVISDHNLVHLVDNELVKKIYNLLAGSSQYKSYIAAPAEDKKSDKKITRIYFF